jgi:hypothetical protein
VVCLLPDATTIRGVVLAADSQPLAQGCWLDTSGYQLCGLHPSFYSDDADELWAKPPLERYKLLEKLRDTMINGVTEFVVSSAGSNVNWACDIGRYWSTLSDKKSGTLRQRFIEMQQSIEQCTSCRMDNLDVSFCSESAWCMFCHQQQQLCNDCERKGYTEWHYLKRKCLECLLKQRHCSRQWVMVLTSDSEATNVKSLREHQTEMDSGLSPATTTIIYDPYHQSRAQRNACANHYLYRNGSRFTFSFLMALRTSTSVVAEKIMKATTESALYGRDKHSMDHVSIAFRSEVTDALVEAKSIVFTIHPERYQSWRVVNQLVNPNGYTGLCQSRRGHLFATTSSMIILVRLSYPTKLQLVNSIDKDHADMKPLSPPQLVNTTRLAAIQAICVYQETSETTSLFVINNGSLYHLSIRWKGSSSQAAINESKTTISSVNVKPSDSWVSLTKLRDNKFALSTENYVYQAEVKDLKDKALSVTCRHKVKIPNRIAGMCRHHVGDDEVFCIVPQVAGKTYGQIIRLSFINASIRVLAHLSNPKDIKRIDQRLVVSDRNCIWSFDLDGNDKRRLAGHSGRDRDATVSVDGPALNAELIKPNYLCVEGGTLFFTNGDNTIKLWTLLEEFRVFIDTCRLFMQTWGILDPLDRAKKDKRKTMRDILLGDAISTLSAIVDDRHDWFEDTKAGLALPVECRKLEGPEGVPSYQAHHQWVANVKGLEWLHQFIYCAFPGHAAHVRLHVFNTMNVENAFAIAATATYDRVQTGDSYVSKRDSIRKELIKSRCKNGFAYRTHIASIYPTSQPFNIEAHIPLALLNKRSEDRKLIKKQKEMIYDVMHKLRPINIIRTLFIKQGQQRIRDMYRRKWAYKHNIVTQLVKDVNSGSDNEDDNDGEERKGTIVTRSRSALAEATFVHVGAHDDMEENKELSEESDYDAQDEDEQEEPYTWLKTGALVIVNIDDGDIKKCPFSVAVVESVSDNRDTVSVWWYYAKTPTSRWNPLYLDRDGRTLRKTKKKHIDIISIESILHGNYDSIKNLQLTPSQQLPSTVLSLLDGWPSLRSWKNIVSK